MSSTDPELTGSPLNSSPRLTRRRIWAARVVAVAATVVVFAAGWWAGGTALTPPQDPETAPGVLGYEVVDGEVSRSLNLTALASWPTVATLAAGAQGIVTSIHVTDGQPLAEGTVLLTVDLRPVVVVQGTVPAFRALSQGVSGPDVAALQGYLRRVGFPLSSPEGRFDAATTSAVRAWQRSLALVASGVVELGDVIFAGTLPARVRLTVATGAVVGPGAALGELVAPAPVFRVAVTNDQLALIPPRAQVVIERAEGTWSGAVASTDLTDPEQPALLLSGVDGTAVCVDSCDEVPVTGSSTWSATAVLVPVTEGPVIPVSAIRTGPDGTMTVRTSGGEDIPVEVVASDSGLAVVSGIEVGTEIEVPTADD